jgi:hypothetical protein
VQPSTCIKLFRIFIGSYTMQITFNAIMSAFLTTGAVKSLNDVYAISFFNICYVPVLSYILYPSNSLFFSSQKPSLCFSSSFCPGTKCFLHILPNTVFCILSFSFFYHPRYHPPHPRSHFFFPKRPK